MTENKDKKEKLARLVLPVLSDSKTLFFDSSSTVSVLAKNFPYEYRTIITTGLNSALILSEKESVSVIIPGGSVSYESNSTAGSLTLKQLSQFNPDCAVFSCGAVYLFCLFSLKIFRLFLLQKKPKSILNKKWRFSKWQVTTKKFQQDNWYPWRCWAQFPSFWFLRSIFL